MTPVTPSPAAPPSLTERQLARLERLADIGMEIAEAAGRRAAALAADPAGIDDGPDPGLTYARAARAVRLTIALQSRLVADRAAGERAVAAARAAEGAQRRHRIHARVEQFIEAERDDADEAERLSSAVWEQLTEADDADLLDRPVAEVVAAICRDLGLSPAEIVPAFAAFADAAPRALATAPRAPPFRTLWDQAPVRPAATGPLTPLPSAAPGPAPA
jgi:hypothetical protein